jgi:hypothetical protein
MRQILILAGLLLAAVLFVGCGGDDEKKEAMTPPQAENAPAVQTPPSPPAH